jgi:hypothetical protein
MASKLQSKMLCHFMLPTAVAWVPNWLSSYGICGGQIDIGADWLRVIPFPLPIITLLAAPHSSSIIWSWYKRPNSGRRTKRTQSHSTPRI